MTNEQFWSARRELRLTVNDMARALAMSRRKIERIEAGQEDIGPRLASRVSELLDDHRRNERLAG